MSSYLYQSGARAGDATALTVGEEPFPRYNAISGIPLTTGLLRLSYFTARKTETVNQMRVLCSATAAAPTPTVVRVGAYTVAANGDLTLVGSTPNDTALLATAQTSYTKAVTAPWTKVAGQRYAVGALCVTTFTAPTVYGCAPLLPAEDGMDPRLGGGVGGLTDLPSTAAAGAVAAGSLMPYVVLAP